MKGVALLLLWTSIHIQSITGTKCHFPSTWTGKWFQSGEKHYISINLTTIQNKGVCVENSGDKFLIEDKSDNGCYRCVVIHEKHTNVLQYKETFCDTREKSLEGLCNLITGDAPLYSMFRADAKPVACPFNHPPFTFTYSRGSGECNYPLSRAEACTEESRMLLKYQACADTNSEATSEELICLAVWKDGSVKYLLGKLEHSRATSEEDRYRCFVYDKKGHKFDIAMSGDATCNGISSSTEGSRTITLSRAETSHHGGKCKFPSWLTSHRSWHTLDHSKTYHVNVHNTTLIVTNTHEAEGNIRIHCQKLFPPTHEDFVLLTAHVTKGCKSGYYCMLFHRRTNHVIELQESGNAAYMEEEACHSRHFRKDSSPFTTLITDAPMLQKCPYLGRRYSITGGLESETVAASVNNQNSNNIISTVTDSTKCNDQENHMLMSVGCQKPETMEIHSDCSREKHSEFSCHGDWAENKTRYVITSPLSRKSGDASRLCFVIYNSAEDGGYQVTTVKETCHRNISQLTDTYYSTFNMTAHGVCSDSGSATIISSWIQLLIIPITMAILNAR